jgi:hypothetical protein
MRMQAIALDGQAGLPPAAPLPCRTGRSMWMKAIALTGFDGSNPKSVSIRIFSSEAAGWMAGSLQAQVWSDRPSLSTSLLNAPEILLGLLWVAEITLISNVGNIYFVGEPH